VLLEMTPAQKRLKIQELQAKLAKLEAKENWSISNSMEFFGRVVSTAKYEFEVTGFIGVLIRQLADLRRAPVEPKPLKPKLVAKLSRKFQR